MDNRQSIKKIYAPKALPKAVDVDCEAVMGPAWAEVRLTSSGLVVPGWRRPFEAGELRSMWARLQQVQILEIENARLRRERADAWQRADAADDRAAWYRSQLRLEARMGLCLARVMT